MPRKPPPEPPKLNWSEFAERRRHEALCRRINRPSQQLARHNQLWLEPWQTSEPILLGGQWLGDSALDRRAAVREKVAARVQKLTRKS